MSQAKCKAKNPATCRYHAMSVDFNKLIPRSSDAEWGQYYADTDKKHFTDKTSPGSKFLNPNLTSLEDLVKLRLKQNPEGLKGDDREALLALGSDENGFLPGTRYLMVKTQGTMGIIHSTQMSPDQLVKIERTKHKAPVSITTVVEKQPEVDYGVLIISDTLNKEHPTLITAFPGPVIKPSMDDRLEKLEGQLLPLKHLKTFLNMENFWVTTQVAK